MSERKTTRFAVLEAERVVKVHERNSGVKKPMKY